MPEQLVRLGILGSGFVADFYLDGLRYVPGTEVVANYSRSAERAQQFGQKRGIATQHTEIADLCADESVDMHRRVALRGSVGRSAALTDPNQGWDCLRWTENPGGFEAGGR